MAIESNENGGESESIESGESEMAKASGGEIAENNRKRNIGETAGVLVA